ncbi:MAG: DUF3467 domain-containing protein [Planctomycetes bacterium]|nr:DUF3467 domain-containing protein [Planctomycetota bacterium]
MEEGTRINTRYPLDPKDLQTVYSNHINILYLREEVYLDFCDVQIQDADRSKAQEDGFLANVPALARVRIVISRAHAARLATVLQNSLKEIEEKESKL